MHLFPRLAFALLAVCPLSLRADEAADIAKFGVTVPTTGLVPAVVDGQALSTLDQDFSADAEPISVDLRPRFTVSGLRGAGHDLVQFRTSLGTFNAELLADGSDAGTEDLDPHISVNNFKSYLATDTTSRAAKTLTYDGTFFHRSANLGNAATPRKILQGAGYRVTSNLAALQKKPAIVREFHYANTRGTIAMARTSEPDSATSEWFINLNDNTPIFNAGTPESSTDDNTYAVFGRVIGSGMSVVDRIGNLPAYNLGGAFSELPLRDVRPGQSQLLLANLVAIDAVRIVPLQPADDGKGGSVLKYTVTNDNPSAATATVSPSGRLLVTKGKRGGRALIKVRASEAGGAFVDSTLTVSHPGAPFVVKQLPAKTTAALGSSLTLTADITAWPLHIRWQRLPAGLSDLTDNWEDIALDDARFEGADTEYLKIKLAGADPVAVGQARALDGSKFRFRLANSADVEGEAAASTLYSRPTLLKVTVTLAFAQPKLAAKTTAALGTTLSLSAPVASGVYPAVTYEWQRMAPGGSWEALVDAKSAVTGSGSAQNPEFPAIPSPYSGTKTATLTLRLTGPEAPAANATSISTLATLALHQSQYRCVITHDRGEGPVSVETTATTLNITTVPVGVATQPAKLVYGYLTQETDAINTTRLTVAAKPAAANTPVSYQWQRFNPSTSQWDNLVNHVPPTAASGDTPASPGAPTAYSGVTTSQLTLRFPADKNTEPGFGLGLDGAQFRCVISNVLKTASAPFGPEAGTAYSSVATLRVVAGTFVYVTDHTFTLPGLPVEAAGRSFAATGLPRGLSLDDETGLITGIPTAKPGVYKIVVTVMDDGVPTTYTYYIQVDALSGGTVGGYEALLSPADAPHLAKLTLQIAGTGALTGTLQTGTEPKPLSLRGAVVRDQETGSLSLTAPISISRPGQPSGHVYLLSDLEIEASGYLSVKLQTRAGADAEPVEIASALYISDDENEDYPGNPGRQLGVYSKKNAAPWANIARYTLAFLDAEPLDTAPEAHPNPVPAGHGYATGMVAADGKLVLRGKLGDGAPFTATLPGDLEGDFRLFLRPYGNLQGGVFSAYLDLTPRGSYTSNFSFFYRYAIAYSLGNEEPEDDFDDGTEVFWSRPAGASKPAAYTAGFGPLGLTARLEPWFVSNYDELGFTDASDVRSGTIDLELSGAALSNLSPNSRELPVSARISYQDSSLTDATPPDTSKFSGLLRVKDGFVSGTLFIRDTVSGVVRERKIPYEGVFLVPEDNFNFGGGTVPANKITAAGLTLIPALPGDTPETGGFKLRK